MKILNLYIQKVLSTINSRWSGDKQLLAPAYAKRRYVVDSTKVHRFKNLMPSILVLAFLAFGSQDAFGQIFNDCGSDKTIDVYTYGLTNGSTSLVVPNPSNFERILVEVWFERFSCSSIEIEGVTATPTGVKDAQGNYDPTDQKEKILLSLIHI